MSINFPQYLPYPTVESYSIKPGEAIIRTDMEAGPARQRRRYTQTPTKISVRWLMNPEQFCIFEAWYKYFATEGGVWFVITLLGGIGLSSQEARFTQQFEAKLLNGYLWEITSELEIRDRPTLTEDETLIVIYSDYVKLMKTFDRLHILVQRTLPIKLN